MEQNEKANATIKGHERERSCEIVIDNAALSVRKRAKAKNVGDGVCVVIEDEVWAARHQRGDQWDVDDR